MKRPVPQRDLLAPLEREKPRPATVSTGVPYFDFVPGPECTPRPGFVVPDELRLPTDDVEWMPEVRVK